MQTICTWITFVLCTRELQFTWDKIHRETREYSLTGGMDGTPSEVHIVNVECLDSWLAKLFLTAAKQAQEKRCLKLNIQNRKENFVDNKWEEITNINCSL